MKDDRRKINLTVNISHPSIVSIDSVFQVIEISSNTLAREIYSSFLLSHLLFNRFDKSKNFGGDLLSFEVLLGLLAQCIKVTVF